MTIAEHRAFSTKNSQRMVAAPRDVQVTRFHIGHIPAAWVAPADAGKKIVLHFHGGGYVLGGVDGHLPLAMLMAQTLKMKVLLPEYRLAPEHPFPAAVDDAVAVYRWLLAQGHDAQNIVVSGDSAGGGLCVAMTAALRDVGEPLPCAVTCMSPWVDLTFTGKSYLTNKGAEAILREDTLREWAAVYCGGENASHPLISPIYGNFRAFPPVFIQVDSDEILLDDALMLAEKVNADGGNTTLKVWNGLWHVWQALGELLPESKKAFEELGAFLANL